MLMFVKTSSSWCVLLLTDSLFSLDPNTTNAFFAAVLAYYSNTECDSDYTNIDIMFHNLLHSWLNNVVSVEKSHQPLLKISVIMILVVINNTTCCGHYSRVATVKVAAFNQVKISNY